MFLFKLAVAILLVAFNNSAPAHYHSGFLSGFDDYAKLHGYDSFSGYLKQKGQCVDLVLLHAPNASLIQLLGFDRDAH